MFALILTGVATLLHLYFSWRVAATPFVARTLGRRNWLILAVFLWLAFLAGMQYRDVATGPGWLLGQFALNWLGTIFIMNMVFLTVDLLTGFGWFFRASLPRLRNGAFVLGVVLVGFAVFQAVRAPVVIPHEVSITGLPRALDGTRLVMLTDLHLGNQRSHTWLAARARQVAALNPDLIVLVGDEVDSDIAEPAAIPPVLAGFQAPLGIWAVLGNHDTFEGEEKTIRLFEAGGVKWLRNSSVALAPGLSLAGVDDLGIARSRGENLDEMVRQALDGTERATVLLSHTPLGVEAARSAGADLMLSGHTHDGQIWPFGLVVRHVFDYVEGAYPLTGMTVIVSRGAGSWGPRMRLWHPGDIRLITLRAAWHTETSSGRK